MFIIVGCGENRIGLGCRRLLRRLRLLLSCGLFVCRRRLYAPGRLAARHAHHKQRADCQTRKKLTHNQPLTGTKPVGIRLDCRQFSPSLGHLASCGTVSQLRSIPERSFFNGSHPFTGPRKFASRRLRHNRIVRHNRSGMGRRRCGRNATTGITANGPITTPAAIGRKIGEFRAMDALRIRLRVAADCYFCETVVRAPMQ